MINKNLIVILGFLLGILLISGCYHAVKSISTPVQEIESTGEIKEFIVEGSEFKFSPTSMTVNKGDKVKLTFKNIGLAGHNFVIGDLGVSTSVISGGSTEMVEFIASKSGTFAFYCSVPGHRSAGMEGQISIG